MLLNLISEIKSHLGHVKYNRSQWVRPYDNLYDIGEFKKSDIEVNKNALIKSERLKQNDLFYIIRK